MMDPLGLRRSERQRRARDMENEVSTEGEVRDNDAEGTCTDEDQDLTPGPRAGDVAEPSPLSKE